jgi:hypothetical protein
MKCKKQTPSVNSHMTVSKNGINMECSKCKNCGSKKCKFVAGAAKKVKGSSFKAVGEGLFDFLGLLG